MNFFLNRHRPILVCDDGTLITYSKGNIFLVSPEGTVIKKVCQLPCRPFLRFLTQFRIFERLLRFEPRCGMFLSSSQILLSYKGGCYRIDLNHGRVYLEMEFRKGMANPLFFTKVPEGCGFPPQIMFGEYWGNLGKESVRVYSRELGIHNSWNILTQFAPGQITHIHNILPDMDRQRLIILTGDTDKESGLWEFKPNYVVPKELISGKQLYRACVGYINQNYFYYATDTPQEKNYFVRLCLSTLKIKKLSSLEGPVIFGSVINDQFIFSTSVEPDTELIGFQYLFSRKVGRGLKSNYCVIYYYDGTDVNETYRFKKDILPMGLFQFGNVSFYTSENKNYSYAYGMSLDHIDGRVSKL